MSHASSPPTSRRIIHVDMDAFFASVEQRDDPALRGRPVAVGGVGERGVVAAASYEARRYGVRSAMPSTVARRRCPDLIFVRPRFDVYRAVSHEVRAIFARYTSLIQPLSLDEAYLDVTAPLIDRGSATAIAEEIRAAIRAETLLTASAGVSYNKLLAKLASDHRKPDGLFVITPRMGPAFVEALPVDKLHGIGPVTAARMEALGIRTGLDLKQQPLEGLVAQFGRSAGHHYYALARAEDDRPVTAERRPKSIGVETTFVRDLADWDEVAPALEPVFGKLWRAYEAAGLLARTVSVKVKYADFRQITRSRTGAEPVTSRASVERTSLELLRPLFPPPNGVRLLGVTLSGLGYPSVRGAMQEQFALALH
jgi:DNA polymerase IV